MDGDVRRSASGPSLAAADLPTMAALAGSYAFVAWIIARTDGRRSTLRHPRAHGLLAVEIVAVDLKPRTR
jgi:hypothetical protein